jgi:hypothetical protein
MHLKPSELIQHGYEPILELPHKEMVPFVLEQLKKHNPVTLFFWGFSALSVLGWLFHIVLAGLEGQLELIGFLSFTGLSLFFFLIPTVPLHELIHGAVYKLLGAPRVAYGADWSKMVFYAIAPSYVVNAREFIVLALAPFVVFTLLFIPLLFLIPPNWLWAVWGLFLLHTSGCAGDFAMVSFCYENRGKDLVTYDEEEVSFFLVKDRDGRNREKRI